MGTKIPLGFWAQHGARTHLRISLVALSAVGFLTVIAALEIMNVSARAISYQNALERSVAQRVQIRRVFITLQDAEIVQRGYLLTDETEFLERFKEIQEEFRKTTDDLLFLMGGGEEQPARARRLADLGATRLTELEAAIVEHRQRSRTAAPAGGVALDAQQIILMPIRSLEEIRALADEMIGFEAQEIHEAAKIIAAQTRWSRNVMITLLGGIAILVTAVLLLGLAYLAHRNRVELDLREGKQLAERASEAKSEFLASMSHEIRTPLTGIVGYTELMLDEDLTPEQRRLARSLWTASIGLSALVDDILDFSKIEAGEIVLAVEPFWLGPMIENVLSIVSVTAQRKKGLRLGSEIDPALPSAVIGDEPRLRQVLLNLLNNAVKFTKDGSVTLRVRWMGTSDAGEIIEFAVVDTGIGISPEKLDRLFQRFSQLDASIQREYGGTGLGLAISKQLVELMGGEIGVESEHGRGSTFWFKVPLPRTESVEEGRTAEGAAPSVTHERILLVDDSPQNQDLVCTVLRKQGYQVDIANDGAEAIAAVQSEPYDLLLMDMQMPRMDGLTATRKIRELEPPARDVPIIALTANVLTAKSEFSAEAGVDDHIAKPFRKNQLLEKVSYWLAAERDPRPAPVIAAATPATHDAEAFEELRSLMGDAWVRSCIGRLLERIDRDFGGPENGMPDRDHLKRCAHQIVADAGQLGFSDLAGACSELEQACAGDGEVVSALDEARRAAGKCRATADRLRAELTSSADMKA